MARATALQAVGHRFKSCPAYLSDSHHNADGAVENRATGERYVFSGLVAQFGLARLPVTQEVAGSSPVGPVLLAKGKFQRQSLRQRRKQPWHANVMAEGYPERTLCARIKRKGSWRSLV